MALLTRWEPFGMFRTGMGRFQREMDDVFNRWGYGFRPGPAPAVGYPALNLWEDEDFVYAEAELPGLKMEDLEIFVTGDIQLTIKGERKPALPENVEWHRHECGFGTFERVITLPAGVDPAGVEARFENGVLAIKMAKTPASKPRKIPVKTG
jgi:HSP20 family protein